jgi:L-alanine-DL-glutamate epimerase-like enolase superfamily enzyme
MLHGQVTSRRRILQDAAGIATAAMTSLSNPARAAAHAAGIRPHDLPDLTIKEVKVYVVKAEAGPERTEEIASVVTTSGIEGNFSLTEHYFHSNWSNEGWLPYAQRLLLGKNALSLPEFTNQFRSEVGQLSYAGAINVCLWDILGKAVNMPVYRLLGGYRDRIRAYASSQHLKAPEDFARDVEHAKSQGFTAYKIHPPWLEGNSVDYKLDIEVAKTVRKTAGDDMPLLFDRVGAYSRLEAMKVGRVLDELNYVSYEDVIPTDDMEGLAELARALDVPITVGEFIFSPYDYSKYIRMHAMDEVRFIVENVGGISGGMKIAQMAECFGMMCQPHNWGTLLDHAAHFHCELAMPNNVWFEMTQPQGITDRPYFKDKLRIEKDGYVPAPVKPGLGYEIDYQTLHNMIEQIRT